MSDDERLRRLLSDAVSDVEPHDRLGELRSSVSSGARGVPPSHSRFSHVATGIVATAAVIGVVAFVTHLATDRSEHVGAATDGGSGPPSATATAVDTSLPSQSPGAAQVHAAAVYYLGKGPDGTVLYREFGPRPADVSPLDYAVQGLMSQPADPDYRTAWRSGWLRSASTGGGQIQVELGGVPETRPASMTGRDASEAVQQVVYTLQAAVRRRDPVLFLHDGSPVVSVLGVPTSLPVPEGQATQVLSLMSISDPVEGLRVSGSRLTVTGVNNGFEASVVVRLMRHGRTFLVKPGIAAGAYDPDRLFPWKITLNVSKLAPGRYTLVASNDDPSGRGRPATDTRTIHLG